MAALYVGATTVILEAFDALEWLRLVAQRRVTRTFAVPAHFIRILEVPEPQRRQIPVSSLQLIGHAGAPCPIPVKRRIIEALAPCGISQASGVSDAAPTPVPLPPPLQPPRTAA